jgi:hypothetical protein
MTIAARRGQPQTRPWRLPWREGPVSSSAAAVLARADISSLTTLAMIGVGAMLATRGGQP